MFCCRNNPYSGAICKVIDDRNIEYENESWSLIALAKHFTGSSSNIAGTRYFKYRGEWLHKLRERLGVQCRAQTPWGRSPKTLQNTKPRTLSGAGIVHQGSSIVVELAGTLPSFFAGLKPETLIYQCFYFAKTEKMPFLSVYCSVRATIQTNCNLMLGSCLLWEIFRMMPCSFCARKNLDKWYNLGAVVILIPLVSYSLLFML